MCRTVESDAVLCRPDTGLSLNVSTGTILQTSYFTLVTVFTHAQLYFPICECEMMVLCMGVAVNQAPQCISSSQPLLTRLLLRCFFGCSHLATLRLPSTSFLQDPYSKTIWTAARSLLRYLSDYSAKWLLASWPQQVAPQNDLHHCRFHSEDCCFVACCVQPEAFQALCILLCKAQSSAEHRALVIVAIPFLRARVEGGALVPLQSFRVARCWIWSDVN